MQAMDNGVTNASWAFSKSQFKLIFKMEYSDNNADVIKYANIFIDWGDTPRTPLWKYPSETLKKIVYCLFIGSPHIGGKVLPNSDINGYAEIKKNRHIFRSHPQSNSPPIR